MEGKRERQSFLSSTFTGTRPSNGGGEGSRTPVRNAVGDGIYTFSGLSWISEQLGQSTALSLLETCLISKGCPVPRRPFQSAILRPYP